MNAAERGPAARRRVRHMIAEQWAVPGATTRPYGRVLADARAAGATTDDLARIVLLAALSVES